MTQQKLGENIVVGSSAHEETWITPISWIPRAQVTSPKLITFIGWKIVRTLKAYAYKM